MIDLLTPSLARRPTSDQGSGRPLAAVAAVAGVAAPVVVLLTLWMVGLVAWYAADGGSHGTTRSVLRVAADAWLLAHGTHLTVGPVTVTASPLGLTLLCLFATYLCARAAGAASVTSDLPTIGLGAVVLAGVYGVSALVISLLASAPGAEPGLGRAFLGGALVGATAGGAGLVRGAGQASALRRSVPIRWLSVGYGALAVLVSMVATGALLTAVSLAAHGPSAARVVDALALDAIGGLFSIVLLLAILPNLALLAATYLLGSGFAFGAGTVVSPGEVVLGRVPSVPVLAALPEDGWAPGWAMGLLAVPVVVGAGSAFLTGRALPTGCYRSGALRGLGAGAVGSLVLAVATTYAGGAIGPGRMAEIGAGFWVTLLNAVLLIGLGGALGGVAGTWWARRRDMPDAEHPQRLAEPPRVMPLAGPEDPTEPVHLPPVSADPLVAHADLAGEETVRLRLPPAR